MFPLTRYRSFRRLIFPVSCILTMKKALGLGETQTLRAGRSKAEPKNFSPVADPFPGAQDGQHLINRRWSLPSATDPVWCRSTHTISSYRGNRPTNKQRPPARPPVANTQTGPITIHCAAKLSALCNQTRNWNNQKIYYKH